MTNQARVSRKPTKYWYERLAQAVLSNVLGAQVAIHDDQSRPSLFDLEVRYERKPWAAVEVTSSRDHRYLRLVNAAFKRGHEPTPTLQRRWSVSLLSGAEVPRVRAGLPSLLRQYEQDCIWDSAEAERNGALTTAQVKTLHDLGVHHCWSALPTGNRSAGFRLATWAMGVRRRRRWRLNSM